MMNGPFLYYIVTILVCFLFNAMITKLDRDSKLNFWVYSFVIAAGCVFICLVFRFLVFKF